MKKTLAVVAGVVVIAYLASPLVIGLLARQQFPDIVKASSVGARQWQPDGFHLGYRHSTARSTLTLPMAGRRPVVVHLHHRITQRLGADLSIMEVTTTASFEGRIREELAQVFGDRSPFVSHTLIFADGHYTATFQSPPVASRSLPGNPAVHFSFSGVKGTVRGTFTPPTATYRMTSPGFALEDDQTHGRVAATGLTLAGDGRHSGPWLQLGGGKFSLDQVTFTPPGQPATEIDGVQFAARIGKETDGLGFTYDIHIARVAAPSGTHISDLALEMTGHRLDEKATEDLARRFAAIAQRGLKPEQAAGLYRQAMVGAAGGFLAHSPEFRIRRLGFTLPAGQVLARADIKFDGTGYTALADPANLRRLSVTAAAKAPVTAVRAAVLAMLRPRVVAFARARRPDATPEQLAGLTARMADRSIDSLLRRHLMRRVQDHYATELRFRKGALTVNGQSMATPSLRAVPH